MTNKSTFMLAIVISVLFIGAILLLAYTVDKDQRKSTAEAVAIEHKLNAPSTTLQSDDFKLKQYGSNQVIVTCINRLEFVVYTDHNIVQVFEPTGRDSQSIPKRCN